MPAAPKLSFGVVIEINQKPVALTATKEALEQFREKGLDLNLPGPVDLGQIGKDLTKLEQIIRNVVPDAPALPGTDSLPGPIKEILEAIEKLDLRVDDLRIHIPGPDKPQDFRYALRIAAEWPAKDEKKLGPITVKGFAFGVESPTDGADGTPDKPDQGK